MSENQIILKLKALLYDIKRMEKYMTEEEKQKVADLVREAAEATE